MCLENGGYFKHEFLLASVREKHCRGGMWCPALEAEERPRNDPSGSLRLYALQQGPRRADWGWPLAQGSVLVGGCTRCSLFSRKP